MKKIFSIVSAVILVATCVLYVMAEQQVFDITNDINWYGSSTMTATIDTTFVPGEKLLKLTTNEGAADNTKIRFDFNGYDSNGNRISIDKKYVVIDYYYKTTTGNLTGKTSQFQLSNFIYIDENGKEQYLKNFDSGVASSGFISTETTIKANEWAPMLVVLERDVANSDNDLNGWRTKYPNALYKDAMLYPYYSSKDKTVTMSADDELYIGEITYYTDKPSGAVYGQTLSCDNGVLKGSARLFQFKNAAKGCVMVIAQYDKDGNVIVCDGKQYTANELTENAFNDISIECSYDITKDFDAKLFIFNDLDSIEPLCDAVSASYTAPIISTVDNELSFANFGIGGAVVNKGITE